MSPRRPPAPRGSDRSTDRTAERPADRPGDRLAMGSRRPAPAARPRSTQRPAVRRPVLTVRGVLFAGVALVGLASVLGPLRAYATQRSELASLREDVAARQVRVAELQRQVQRWDDPAYVSAQARTRLHDVMPGETGYVVLDAPSPPPGPTAGTAPTALPKSGGTWRSRLADTLGLDGADGGDGLLEPVAPSTGAARP